MTEDRFADVGAGGDEHPDAVRSAGSGSLDLTPRPVAAEPSAARTWLPRGLLAVVVVALGFVIFQTLGDAALFFYNADEAVERRDELADQRFRLQGTPFGEPVTTSFTRDDRTEVGVVFPVAFEGVVADIIHVGSPAELFQPGVPVVLEGTWVRGLPAGVDRITQGANDGWYFASTDMFVKHDNEYRNDNQDRLDDAERGGFVEEASAPAGDE